MADVNLVEEETKINGFGSKLELEGETARMQEALKTLKTLLGISGYSILNRNLSEEEKAISVSAGKGAADVRIITSEINAYLMKVNMVNLNARTHGVTATELINDARNNFTGINRELPLKEYIEHLPDALEKILYTVIKGIHYKPSSRETRLGLALCDLAAVIASLQDKLDENENS
ncbi:hypothetical protein KAI46_02280 [bacterium]|nr:hypothetical protein [bacterium]